MAIIGNRDFLCRSQVEDHDVWDRSLGNFWKKLDTYQKQLTEPATAPALIDAAISVADWRSRQFKQILDAVAESRLQKDPEKFQEVFSGIAYIYRRFVEKSAKEPLAPASGSLVKFLKNIQAGIVAAKEELGALVPEPHLELVQGDPLQRFKMVLVSPEYSDDVKFGVVAQGFDFAFHVMSNQAKKLQKVVRRVVGLEATVVKETKAREDLEKKLKDGEAESKKQNDEMGGLKKKLEDSEKAREEQKEKLTQQEQRSRVQEQQLQTMHEGIRATAQAAAKKRKIDKEKAQTAASRAFDEMTKWSILAGVTLGMGIPRMMRKEGSWALLSAQWEHFDELEGIPDLAERTRMTHIYANEELREEGCLTPPFKGKNVYPNGRWYIGEFFDDQTLITGILEGPDDYWYKGRFYGGKPHGDDGEERTLEGTYTGQFYKGFRHGHGTFEMADGDEYSGFFSEGLREGPGRLDLANGDCYMGHFKKDKFHDEEGYYFFENGTEFVGEFRDGKMYGHGTLRYANGDVFEGMFENNLIHGHGTMRWADGTVKEGDF